MNTLDAEIAAARKAFDRYDAAGDAYHADVAAARLAGLTRARDLLLGGEVRPSCPHVRHDRVGDRLICAACNEPWPHTNDGRNRREADDRAET